MVPQIRFVFASIWSDLYSPLFFAISAPRFSVDVDKLIGVADDSCCTCFYVLLGFPIMLSRDGTDPRLLILVFHDRPHPAALSRGPWKLWFPNMKDDVVSQYGTNADYFLIGLQLQGTSLEMAKALRTAIIEQLRIETITKNDLSDINNILKSRWHWPTIEAKTKQLLIEQNPAGILWTMSLCRQGLPLDLLPKVAGYIYDSKTPENDERKALENFISTVAEQKQHERQQQLTNVSLSSNPNTQFGLHHDSTTTLSNPSISPK